MGRWVSEPTPNPETSAHRKRRGHSRFSETYTNAHTGSPLLCEESFSEQKEQRGRPLHKKEDKVAGSIRRSVGNTTNEKGFHWWAVQAAHYLILPHKHTHTGPLPPVSALADSFTLQDRTN